VKTAIVATALLSSLSTTALMQVSHAWRTESGQADTLVPTLDMQSTGSLSRQLLEDKGHALWTSAAGKGSRLVSSSPGQAWDLPSIAAHASARGDRPVLLAQAAPTTASDAITAPPSPEAAPSSATTTPSPTIDETALRYFASQGDQRRLDAEIARLRALYPDWTPPADPLAVPDIGDPQLDAMWQLYSQGKYAELRKAISDRQTADPNWQVPADLLERIGVAEARERLVNASDLKQFETVVRTAAETPSLLTCAEVDVLWRLAEAFAQTDRPERARDAYKYVLDSCTNPAERVATVEKAIPLLPRPLIEQLLSTERKDANGVGEFQAARLALSRQLIADAGNDPKLVVPQADLDALKAVAEPDTGSASDAQLLGWYFIRRDQPADAETWFTKARDREDTAEASQGLALAKIALDKPGEAEDILYNFRDETDEIRAVYMAAAANFLAVEPRVAIDPLVLSRMAQETADAKDAAAAQQFGWYARDLNQHQTAAEWFTTALRWKPDDEPSAYGLVLTLNLLGDRAGVREVQSLWRRSDRIANLGEPRRATTGSGRIPAPTGEPNSAASAYAAPVLAVTPIKEAPPARPEPVRIAPAVERIAPAEPVDLTRAAPVQDAYRTARSRSTPVNADAGRAGVQQAPLRRSCSTTNNYSQLSGAAALARGWCLSDLNRPMEAIAAFERAMQTGNATVQREAAWGQSLAYLSRNLVDDAAVSASKAPLSSQQSHQLQVEILTQRAVGFSEQKRWNESLLALDQRSRLATERIDLMVLRGYAYLNLKRLKDAERTFQAMVAVGSSEGYKGLAFVREAQRRP